MSKLFGKLPPVNDYRTLRFADYSAGLTPPPTSYSAWARVAQLLKISSTTPIFPMDFNDVYGDCTIAALAHADTMYNGLLSKLNIMTKEDVLKIYLQLTGGADTGLDMLTVLNYWRHTMVSGNDLLSYVKLDPKNHVNVQQAIYIFGGVYLGFQVQKNCIQEFDARLPWTPAKLTRDGHCVFAVGYEPTDLTMLTWGSTQKGTWKWWDECVDEAYVLLPSEAKVAGFAPGFDFTQLQADLQLL